MVLTVVDESAPDLRTTPSIPSSNSSAASDLRTIHSVAADVGNYLCMVVSKGDRTKDFPSIAGIMPIRYRSSSTIVAQY